MNKRILVTGGTGLVGSTITADIKLSSKDVNLLNFTETLHQCFQIHRPDNIIHCAARVGGLGGNMNYKGEFFYDNVLMNINVLEAARRINVKKLVSFLSTCVFPDNVEYPLTEEKIHLGEPHSSNYPYAYSKRMLDIQSRSYREQYEVNYVSIIPTNVYGPRDNFDLKNGHVMPMLMHKCYLAKLNKTDLNVWGTGNALREFIYSEDVGKLTEWALHNYEEVEPIIFSPSEEITITGHNFETGDAVMYKQIDSGTGFSIGLTTNTTYYVSKVDDNKIKLYNTYSNATTSGATGLQDISTSILTGSHLLSRHVAGLKNVHATANVIVKAYPMDQTSEVSNGQYPKVWRIFLDEITGKFAVGDAIKMGSLVGEIINVHNYQSKPLAKYKLKDTGTAAQLKQLDKAILLDGGGEYKIPPQPYVHWVTNTTERTYATEGHANIKAYGSNIGSIKSIDIIDSGTDYVSTDQVIFPVKPVGIFSIVTLLNGEKGSKKCTGNRNY